MQQKFIRPTITWILALALFTVVFGQPNFSQVSGRSSSAASGSSSFASGSSVGADGFGGQFAQPAARLQQQSGTVLPSDNSIDENEYMIGSGDVFFITAVESPNIRYTAAVDQTGKAFIPGVGVVTIGKTSYADAKKIIAEYITSMMRNPSEIYVTLIQTKKATVSFTGRIRYPGSYEFPGNTRLLDAIRSANDGDLPMASDADLRQIVYISGDDVTTYNLMDYLHKGDNTQNPYIYPGDQIRINPTTDRVFISGAIKSPNPNFYPLKKGETLRSFLSIFTFDNNADTANIILHRAADNSTKTLSSTDPDITLYDLDAITIPVRRNLSGMFTVSITGEVASPGHYPIIENSTSAKLLIEKAGGAKPTANMDLAVVIRPIKNLPERLNSGAQQMATVRPEKGTSITMASSSLDYTVIKLIQYNSDKILLEPGDQIFIPKKDNFVYVSGAVKSPGAYPFLRNRDSKYYISQAGGYSNNADRSNVQVFLKYGDVVQSVEPKCVEPGSVILVPSSVQYKFLTQVMLPIISTVATTLAVGISIYTMTK